MVVQNEVINSKNEVIKSRNYLTSNEIAILELIAKKPSITKPEIKEATKLSVSTIDRTLKSLKEK